MFGLDSYYDDDRNLREKSIESVREVANLAIPTFISRLKAIHILGIDFIKKQFIS